MQLPLSLCVCLSPRLSVALSLSLSLCVCVSLCVCLSLSPCCAAQGCDTRSTIERFSEVVPTDADVVVVALALNNEGLPGEISDKAMDSVVASFLVHLKHIGRMIERLGAVPSTYGGGGGGRWWRVAHWWVVVDGWLMGGVGWRGAK